MTYSDRPVFRNTCPRETLGLRATGYGLRATGYGLRAAGCPARYAGFLGCELLFQCLHQALELLHHRVTSRDDVAPGGLLNEAKVMTQGREILQLACRAE